MSADLKAEYNSIVNYDYLLGAALPGTVPLVKDTDKLVSQIFSHDYNTKEKLPSLKDSDVGQQRIEYVDVVAYDYVANQQESQQLQTIRFLEDLVEKTHKALLNLHSQNSRLKEAVVRLAAEKHILLTLPENTKLRPIFELEQELEQVKQRLSAQIVALTNELERQQQRTTFQSDIFDRLLGKDKRLEEARATNARIMAENLRLSDEIEALKKRQRSGLSTQ